MHHNFIFYLDYISQLSYWKIYLTVIASGHLIPIPESVMLLFLGLLSATGHGEIFILIFIGTLSALTVDLIMYSLGLMGFNTYIKKHFDKHLERFENVEERNLLFLVFISHFVPGWRLANPLIAGSTGMPRRKFIFYTAISCLLYVSIFVTIGHIFHKDLPHIIAIIESFHRTILLILLGIIIGAALLLLSSRKGK